ncbi:hypothetical protein AAF712_014506 [Marasmius tenuissimus]|uniref:3-oxo-5-alpha-steroid 4-dehydrogenase C-terminal domain-containing protein n=1 Tax=Marasmius tenuissimus TaxID=585030 RepID=A0ABR2ZD04_9AGAR
MSLADRVSNFISVPQARFLYDSARKYFLLMAMATFPATFFYDARFGRFSGGKGQGGQGWMYVNGNVSWMIMEIVSPICCTLSFFASPLAMPSFTPIPLYTGQKVLLSLFLIHYTNRAIICPLRTPSRSKAHISVPIAAVIFNLLNGTLIGAYLNSPQARIWLAGKEKQWWWWGAIAVWALGFVGNVVHDEILLNIRRKHKKGQSDKKNDDAPKDKPKQQGEHYAIPHGLLYEYITFPNYFCEWIEWLGFAVAASPVPFSLVDMLSLASPATLAQIPAIPALLKDFVQAPPMFFMRFFTPPWIFLVNEVLAMFPRAYRGHLWYKEKFGDAYPKNRKIVIPGLL